MPEGYWVTVRRGQKQQLFDFLNEHKDKPLTQVLALFSYKTGLRVATLKIYVEELQQAGLIKIESNFVR